MRWLSIVALLMLALSTGCGRGDEDGGVGGGGGEGGAAAAPGITEKAIKLGGSYPFSGPASAYASIALGAQARFKYENSKGGVDGRQIEFIVLDDGYEPQRAVTNVRRLVEEDQVFALFNTLGTPNNLAIWDYANQKKVPHLFVATGASDWGADVAAHPYTTGWQPDYVSEAKTTRTSSRTRNRTRRSPCSIRTTASARTCSAASRRRSRAPAWRSSRARATR